MKVAFVSGVCVRYDAVSEALLANLGAVAAIEGNEVMLYSFRCDFESVPHLDVNGVEELARQPFFQDADVVVLHFAIFNPLFYALLMAPKQAKVIVVFHNITPKRLLPVWQHELIDQSFEQLTLLSFADHVLCDSAVNLELLRSIGVRTPATVHSLSSRTRLASPSSKPSFQDAVLRLLFVGRFVRSKGPQDLLAAMMSVMPELSHDQVELTFIGNVEFSDPEVLEEMRRAIRLVHSEFRGRLSVRILGDADEETKAKALSDADVFVLPTYHEGFCVPILEALSSGCRVLVYDNSNTPHISGGFATLVETGDVPRLGVELIRLALDVSSPEWAQRRYEEYRTATAEYAEAFAPEISSERFTTRLRDVAVGR